MTTLNVFTIYALFTVCPGQKLPVYQYSEAYLTAGIRRTVGDGFGIYIYSVYV